MQKQIEQANKLFEEKKYQEALNQYDVILKAEQKTSEAFYMRGRTLFMLRMDEKRIYADYAEALNLEPTNLEYRYVVGKSLFRQKQYSKALKCFEQVYESDNKRLDALLFKGDVLEWMDQPIKQQECYKAVLSHDPRNAQALSKLVAGFETFGDRNEAVKFLDDLIQSVPDHALAWALKGNVLLRLSNSLKNNSTRTEALESYEKSVILDPKCVVGWMGIGNAQKDKSPEIAIKAFNEALSINPKHTMAPLAKGECLFALRKFDEALPFLSKCTGLSDDYYYSLYIECLLETGNHKTAEEIFLSVNARFAGDPDWAKLKAKTNKSKAGKIEKGSHALSDTETEWATEINEFLIKINKEIGSALCGIVMEWDRQDDDGIQVQFIALNGFLSEALEKKITNYYAIDGQAISVDHFSHVGEKIKSKKSFDKLISNVTASVAFQALKGEKTFFFSIQEHDNKTNYYNKVIK
jgi:tetratricopeptide (TPR) repeat protein